MIHHQETYFAERSRTRFGGRERPKVQALPSDEMTQEFILDEPTSMVYDVDMAKRRSMKMTDQVRQAIGHSGLTRYRIAQETGIDESALAKFFHGQRGLSLDNLDRLCAYLGLRIVMDRRPKTRGK